MKRLSTLLLFILTIHAYGQVDKEVYSIYSLIINEELKNDSSADHKTIIIQSKTSAQHAPASIEAICGFVKMDQPIFCNYPGNINEVIAKNTELKSLLLNLDKVKDKQILLTQNLTINAPYQLIEPKNFYAKFRKGADAGWQQLKTDNPGLFGVVEFSNVVINGNFAVVYFGCQRNAFNGSGSIIVLKKEDGQWKIISRPEVWVS